jgi:putative heme iron utilization protein
VLGTAARKELQTSLLKRVGRSLTTYGPMLTGAAGAGYLNRRATKNLGDHIKKDLRKSRSRIIDG